MSSYLTAFLSQGVYNAARLFELVCQHTIQIEEWEDKLAVMKSTAAKEAESAAAIIKSLRE